MDMQNGHNSRSKHSDTDPVGGDNNDGRTAEATTAAATTSTVARRVANKRKRHVAQDGGSIAGNDSDSEQQHQPTKKLRTIRPKAPPVESDVPQSSSQSSCEMPALHSVSSDVSSLVDVDGYAPESEPPAPASQPASTVDDAAWSDAAEIVAGEEGAGDDDDDADADYIDWMEPEYFSDGTASSTNSEPILSPEHPSAAAAAAAATHRPPPRSPASQARAIGRAKVRARERRHYRIAEGHLIDGNDMAADSRKIHGCPLASPGAEDRAVAKLVAAGTTEPSALRQCVFGVGRNATPFGSDRTKPADRRQCPLPPLAWASATDVWRLMCRKDERALLERDPLMLDRHPGIHVRMRAILLDWLMEVCEVYKLHRETYYLAVDYLDRYITNNERLPKTRLQLIGITCLFTAAKVEEIYPPKISEFAYVTDGACTEADIIQQEMILMLGLGWSINPVTIIGWLSVYMQLNCSNRTAANFGRLNADGTIEDAKRAALQRDADAAFVYPQFSALEFVLAARVLDLCTLDVDMANFQYSVVAAAVLVLTIDRETALRVSGFDWHVLKPCVKWMEPYFEVSMQDSAQLFLAEQNEQIRQSYGLRHLSADITTDDSHIIQTHTTSVVLFEAVQKLRERNRMHDMHLNRMVSAGHAAVAAANLKKKQQSTPAANTKTDDIELLSSVGGGPLTPPDSNRKLNDSLPTSAAEAKTPAANGNGNGTRLNAAGIDAAADSGCPSEVDCVEGRNGGATMRTAPN